MRRAVKPAVSRSSGNVFEDLRVAAPAEALAKSELAAILAEAIRARRLTQAAAARVLGVDQPKVSELLRGRLARFSTERLVLLLLRLGRDVEIVVRPPRVSGDHVGPGRLQVRTTGPRRTAGRSDVSAQA